MANYLTTYQGHHIDPLNPKVEDIELIDIAHALSLVCRGNGQTTHFYSVGQHCINCAKEAETRRLSIRIQFICLLHDAAEAYMADLIRPIKNHMDGYQKIEDNFLSVVLKKFHLEDMTEEEWKQVKEIDDDLLQFDLVELLKEPMPQSGYHFMRVPDIEFKDFHEVEVEYYNLAMKYIEALEVK